MFEQHVAGWLRRVELQPGTDRHAAIVDAAQGLDSTLTHDECLALVTLAHSIPDAAAFELIRDEVVSRDETFGCAVDDLETRIIAGVFTAALMELNSDLSILAAQSVLSAAWTGLSSEVSALPGLAITALKSRSEHLRSRSGFAITTDITGAAKAVPTIAGDDDAATHSELKAMAAALTKALETIKRSFEQASQRMNSRLAASDEELDILWWAFSGYSEIEDSSWAEARGSRRPLVMATELAQLTRFVVEPPSARAIFSRLLGPGGPETLTVAAAVEDACSSGVNLPAYSRCRLLPVLSSVGECVDFEGKPSWKDSVGRSGIRVDVEVSQLDLAVQTLRELMMTKILGEP